MALTQASGTGGNRWLIIAESNRLLRESLCLELAALGCRVAEFGAIEPLLAHLHDGASAHGLIVESALAASWDGDPRAALSAARAAMPVILLGEPGRDGTVARRWNAVEVMDRGQPAGSIARRLRQAIEIGARLAPAARWPEPHDTGPLSVSRDGSCAFWKGRQVELTEPELALLHGLAAHPGDSLTYLRAREILTGSQRRSTDISPEQVGALVRRLRKKFREVDPGFDHIAFVPGCGYCWRDPAAQVLTLPA
jgi:two-component system response regulator ChvI